MAPIVYCLFMLGDNQAVGVLRGILMSLSNSRTFPLSLVFLVLMMELRRI